MNSYDPPLKMEAAWNMIKTGPTEEQELIGTPKEFGGLVIDGSVCRVEIL